jgi:hypothetical protein
LAKNKQFQGSKKKARKEAFLERRARRQERCDEIKRAKMPLESGDIEQLANAMGIKLK